MRVIAFSTSGSERTARVLERPTSVPVGRQVLLRVRYAGLNPADLLQLRGGYPSPAGSPADVAGIEVAGVIEQCAGGVTTMSVGDRVFGLVAGGGLADRVVAESELLTPVPPSLDECAAAAVPESFITAHDALFTQARLRSGERVVVHGGTGGVGTAAIGLAKLAGAEVYATARSTSGRNLVRDLGAVALDPEDFVNGIREHCGATGIDVVVELIGAPNFPANLEVLAPGARIVAVGIGGGSQVTFSLNALMRARARIIGTVLRTRPQAEKACAVAAFAREVVPHLAAGRVTPLIDEVFPVHACEAAFTRLATSGRRGNLLVDFTCAPSGTSGSTHGAERVGEPVDNKRESTTCRR